MKPHLEYILLIIFGLFLLVRLIRAKRQRRLVERQQAQPASAPPVTPAPQPLVPPEIIGPREPVPLAAQLHQIESSFAVAVWCMHYALEFFLVADPRPATGAPAVLTKDWWRENPILPLIFRDYFRRRAALGDAATFGNALQSSFASSPALIRAFLERVNHPFAATLIGQVDEWQRTSVDRAFLATFGRFWSDGRDNEILVEPDAWRQPLAVAASTLQQTMPRSLLISGEPLVGKARCCACSPVVCAARAGRSLNRAVPI